MADSSDIDAAIVNKLFADATLKSLMPDGVFMDSAGLSVTTGKNATRFVVITLVDPNDVAVFGQRGYEESLYLVKAVALAGPGGGNVKDAAKRIDDLLEDQPLTVAGYTWGGTYRVRRLRDQEIDSADSTIKWNHRGGFYRVHMTPTAS